MLDYNFLFELAGRTTAAMQPSQMLHTQCLPSVRSRSRSSAVAEGAFRKGQLDCAELFDFLI